MSEEADISGAIEEEPRGRLGRLRGSLRRKIEASRAEKARIKAIAAQERKSLERRFIREREKKKLARKFGVQETVRTKVKKKGRKKIITRTVEKFAPQKQQRQIDFGGLSAVGPGQRSAGLDIMEGLDRLNFGGAPKTKRKKQPVLPF